MIGLGVLGCRGRMGRLVVEEILRDPRCRLVAAASRGIREEYKDAAGALFTPNHARVIMADDVDVVIDFTAAAATAKFARLASEHGKAFMSGTTGLSKGAMGTLKLAAEHIPLLYAPNTSLGLFALRQAIILAAQKLQEFYCQAEIEEIHHADKSDRISGTALMLNDDIRKAGAGKIEQKKIVSIREGEIVGTHTVKFHFLGEDVGLTHIAEDRSVYAKGAVRAALWLHGKPPGLYGMEHVLALYKNAESFCALRP